MNDIQECCPKDLLTKILKELEKCSCIQQDVHKDDKFKENELILKCTDKNLLEQVKELKSEITDNEITFNECKCKMNEQISDLVENNNLLSETLEIITAENKNNLETIAQLKNELKESSKQNDQYRDKLQSKVSMITHTETILELIPETEILETENDKPMESDLQELKQDPDVFVCECTKLNEDCKMQSNDATTLRKSIRDQVTEIDTLQNENDELKSQIDKIKWENKNEVDKLQNMVLQFQNQIEILLKEHDEKTDKIQSVVHELNKIRKNAIEESEKFSIKIKELEDERDAHKSKCLEYEKKLEGCKCGDVCTELERLNKENITKQCLIVELEKNIDDFNENMREFEKNVKNIAEENELLRNSNEKLLKSNETLQEHLKQSLSIQTTATSTLKEENFTLRNELEKIKTQYARKTQELQLENDNLKQNLYELQENAHDSEKQNRKHSLELEMQIQDLQQKHKRDTINLSELQQLRENHSKLKQNYDDVVFKNAVTQQELNKCILNMKQAEARHRQEISNLEIEMKQLKDELRENDRRESAVVQQFSQLKEIHTTLKEEYARKSIENEKVQHELQDKISERQRCKEECVALIKERLENEKELSELAQKYNRLERGFDEKMQEIRKLKKQCESCSKQSQISREEYNNLKKEYKEIKVMLAEQISKYRKDTDQLEGVEINPCKVVLDLKKQLFEKEKLIGVLQQKIKDASYEIIELKDYIHKLASDNNILRSAINNLVDNLERKIRGMTADNSTEAIAGEILHSLTTIENNIKISDTCPMKDDCSCMSEILLRYGIDSNPPTRDENKKTRYILSESSATITDSDDLHYLRKESAGDPRGSKNKE
ncbi:uncharacterized protein LOC132700372 isoform X2 [Cylas formicarius]|nr:uncharacterized protein LOC132700372 isoform X2 [Cylas formicarius]